MGRDETSRVGQEAEGSRWAESSQHTARLGWACRRPGRHGAAVAGAPAGGATPAAAAAAVAAAAAGAAAAAVAAAAAGAAAGLIRLPATQRQGEPAPGCSGAARLWGGGGRRRLVGQQGRQALGCSTHRARAPTAVLRSALLRPPSTPLSPFSPAAAETYTLPCLGPHQTSYSRLRDIRMGHSGSYRPPRTPAAPASLLGPSLPHHYLPKGTAESYTL